jgi:xanthine dehydrogenase YagS FAD-binding subunit
LNLEIRNNTIEDARVVFGGIAGRPLRETVVEGALKGKTLGTGLVGEVLPHALVNAAPLKYNAMKIEMAKGLLASGLDKLVRS